MTCMTHWRHFSQSSLRESLTREVMEKTRLCVIMRHTPPRSISDIPSHALIFVVLTCRYPFSSSRNPIARFDRARSPFALAHSVYLRYSSPAETCPALFSYVHSSRKGVSRSSARRYSATAARTETGGRSPVRCHSRQPRTIHARIPARSSGVWSWSPRVLSRRSSGTVFVKGTIRSRRHSAPPVPLIWGL